MAGRPYTVSDLDTALAALGLHPQLDGERRRIPCPAPNHPGDRSEANCAVWIGHVGGIGAKCHSAGCSHREILEGLAVCAGAAMSGVGQVVMRGTVEHRPRPLSMVVLRRLGRPEPPVLPEWRMADQLRDLNPVASRAIDLAHAHAFRRLRSRRGVGNPRSAEHFLAFVQSVRAASNRETLSLLYRLAVTALRMMRQRSTAAQWLRTRIGCSRRPPPPIVSAQSAPRKSDHTSLDPPKA